MAWGGEQSVGSPPDVFRIRGDYADLLPAMNVQDSHRSPAGNVLSSRFTAKQCRAWLSPHRPGREPSTDRGKGYLPALNDRFPPPEESGEPARFRGRWS